MVLHVKIFGAYRFQEVEVAFNKWADEVNPYVVKTILDTVPVPRNDSAHSLFFTMVIFYTAYEEPPEVISRKVGGAING